MALEIPSRIKAGITPDIVQKEYFALHEASSPKHHTRHAEKSLNQAEIEKSINLLEKTGLLFNKRLKFSINKEIDRVVVKVIDSSTDKVIKEIPPGEIQRLIARIKETIGLLVDERI